MSAPTFGELGTYVGGQVVDPDSFRLVSPKRRAGGTVIAVYPADPTHVLIRDEKTDAEIVVRIGGRR